MSKFANKISKIYQWLLRDQIGQALSLFSSYLILYYLLAFNIFYTEFSIRTIGGLLQLSGMVLAINGLTKIWNHFEKKHLTEALKEWLNKFPLLNSEETVEFHLHSDVDLITSIVVHEKHIMY